MSSLALLEAQTVCHFDLTQHWSMCVNTQEGVGKEQPDWTIVRRGRDLHEGA